MVRGISTAITVRRAAAIAIAGAAAAALSACGAGLETQTDQKQSAIAGVNVDKDDLALRDLAVEFDEVGGYETGDDAALRVWIGNEGTEEVSLVGVETDAGTVTFVSADSEATPTGDANTPTGEPTASPGEPTTAAEETSAPTGEETSAPDGEETSSPAGDATSEAPTSGADALDGETSFEIPIAVGDYVRLDQSAQSSGHLLIENVGEELRTGEAVRVTFLFSDGTEVEVDLPIAPPVDAADREYYEPEAEAEGH